MENKQSTFNTTLILTNIHAKALLRKELSPKSRSNSIANNSTDTLESCLQKIFNFQDKSSKEAVL